MTAAASNAKPLTKSAAASSAHWADREAARIINERGEKDRYVLAAGISPSGTVHVGNFRELMVVDLVARALRQRGKTVRFIFSWDNFDPLRKLPKNFPQVTSTGTPFAEYLGMPLIDVPDPKGEYTSYAQRNQEQFETAIARAGIKPEFIDQSEQYKKGVYTEVLRTGLNRRADIRRVLNKHRSTPLPETWFPVALFCEQCRKAVKTIKAYDGVYTLDYDCHTCGADRKLNFKETPLVKFLWRIDWPMRWQHEGVDFEPGGKDHSSEGGSYTTACELVREIFDDKAPVYLQYDFVLVKGKLEKMSSSKGNAISVAELLNVYEPMVARWLYAAPRPNVDFTLALDQDVIKNYEAFDRLQRVYDAAAGELSVQRRNEVTRLYELARVTQLPTGEGVTAGKAPRRAAFRHLCNVAQLYDFNEAAVLKHYAAELGTEAATRSALMERMRCAAHWLKHYAGERFCFKVRETAVSVEELLQEGERQLPQLKEIKASMLAVLAELCALLSDVNAWETLSENTLEQWFYETLRKYDDLNMNKQSFFACMYLLLIGKERGPRLANFMLILGRERLNKLLAPSVLKN